MSYYHELVNETPGMTNGRLIAACAEVDRLRTDLAAARAEAERAKASERHLFELGRSSAIAADNWKGLLAATESRCATLAKECEELKDKLLSQEKRIGFQYAQKWNDVSHGIVQELSILYKDIQACESGRMPEQDSKQAELTRLHQAVAALKTNPRCILAGR